MFALGSTLLDMDPKYKIRGGAGGVENFLENLLSQVDALPSYIYIFFHIFDRFCNSMSSTRESKLRMRAGRAHAPKEGRLLFQRAIQPERRSSS